MMSIHDPTPEQREEIIENTIRMVEKRFYDPALHGVDLRSVVNSQAEELLDTPDFPAAMAHALEELQAYPVDFSHKTNRKVPLGRQARATFHAPNGARSKWVFQDVLIDGPAHGAGIKSGAILLGINGQEIAANQNPMISATAPTTIQFRNPHSPPGSFTIEATLPVAKKKRDTSRNLIFRKLKPTVGYMRISAFPGILGIDIARETDRAISSLNGVTRLIIDLRGNWGPAGIGNLRLMSYLTPGRIPVGYSLTRRGAEQGYKREQLARFEGIPSNKFLAPFTPWKFRKLDKSIVVVTEGLGQQPFHGRTVLLVNEHTLSGAEVVAGFAAEHRRAVIVGTRTAGRMLAWASLPVGHGYFMTIPTRNYLTWEGKSFEGTGIIPDVEAPYSLEAANDGRDSQLERAIEIAKTL